MDAKRELVIVAAGMIGVTLGIIAGVLLWLRWLL
jgi:hypothetical protein